MGQYVNAISSFFWPALFSYTFFTYQKQLQVMRKIFGFILFLFATMLILLSTVDLKPYLSQHSSVSVDTRTGAVDTLSQIVESDLKTSTSDYSNLVQSGPEGLAFQNNNSAQPDVSKEKSIPPSLDGKGSAVNEDLGSAKNVDISNKDMQLKWTQLSDQRQIDVSAVSNNFVANGLGYFALENLPPQELPYSILLDTFSEKVTAQEAIDIYLQRTIQAHWVKVNLGPKGVRYRLFAGAFSTVSAAKNYLKKNKIEGKLIKKTPYTSLVGVYGSKVRALEVLRSIGNSDYIPCLLGGKGGNYTLSVGASYTLKGAREQCRQLTISNIPCKSAKRSTAI